MILKIGSLAINPSFFERPSREEPLKLPSPFSSKDIDGKSLTDCVLPEFDLSKVHPEFQDRMREVFPDAKEQDIALFCAYYIQGAELEQQKQEQGRIPYLNPTRFMQGLKRELDAALFERLPSDDSLPILGVQALKIMEESISSYIKNPFFEFAFQMLGKELKDPFGPSDGLVRPVSLWTGGEATMKHAAWQGFAVLEKSKIGAILNGRNEHFSWHFFYPLWTFLSFAFVKHSMGKVDGKMSPQLTYHFRVGDPLSIGSVIELKTAFFSQLAKGEDTLKVKLCPVAEKEGALYTGDAREIEFNLSNINEAGVILMAMMGEMHDEIVTIASLVKAQKLRRASESSFVRIVAQSMQKPDHQPSGLFRRVQSVENLERANSFSLLRQERIRRESITEGV